MWRWWLAADGGYGCQGGWRGGGAVAWRCSGAGSFRARVCVYVCAHARVCACACACGLCLTLAAPSAMCRQLIGRQALRACKALLMLERAVCMVRGRSSHPLML